MKKICTFLILAFIVSFSLESFSQTAPWIWQHPTPQGNTLRWVKYWDANNWYAVGYVGTFMKTTNAGANWTWKNNALGQYSNSGQANWCYGAYFFNQNTGIVYGQGNSVSGANGIYRTTNGGTTFDTTNVVPWMAGTFYFAYFVNNNLGFAGCTSAPYVYRTTNGGISWTGLTSPTVAAYDIYASDSLNIIISNASGNVRKSTDGGATWTTILTGTSATLYRMVFANPNVGFTAGGSTAASIFRYTTNGGLNWTTPANTGLAASTMYDIDYRFSSTTTPPFVETFTSATFPPTGWTIDGTYWLRYDSTAYGIGAGGSAKYNFWSSSTGIMDTLASPVFTATSAGDTLLLDVAYAPYDGANDAISLQTSTNAGTSYTQLILMDSTVMRTVPQTSSHFYPNRNQWKTLRYVLPAGTNKLQFVAISGFGNDAYLDNVTVKYMSSSISSTIYLTGNSFAIYKSTNMGTSWDTVGILAPTQPWTSTFYSTDLSPYGGDTLLTVGAFGLYNRRAGSTNFTTYTNLQKPGTNYDVWAQSATGNVLVVGGPTSAGGSFDQILKSTNGGTTWSIVPFSTTSTSTFYCIQMLDNNTGFVSGTNGAVYRTTNGGNNWDSIAVEGSTSSATFRKVDFINANTGWVFTTFTATITDSATIFKTTNAGVNWTKQYITSVGSTAGSYRGVYGADMLDANTGWLLSYQPRPWRTTNGGANWMIDSISDGFSGTMYDIRMFSATSGYVVGSSGRMYKLTAAGIWDTVTVPTRNFAYYGLDFSDKNNGYIFGASGTCFATTNAGVNWLNYNTMGATMYNGFMTSDLKAFSVGSSGYIFKNNNALTGVAGNNEPQLPTRFSLEQNYPNPFNPTTTIEFALPRTGFVSLKIYDVAGREILSALNTRLNAGITKYTFNGANFASGVYFYRLLVDGNQIDTKKMVLVK
jgi:photosystem II stability/assembly factor-like uncharacterized protein